MHGVETRPQFAGYWTEYDENAARSVDLKLFYEKMVLRIPCGQCMECRLAYSREWADRMMLERLYHDSSYFVTLTYDDEHVPRNVLYSGEGDVVSVMTLRKTDMQKFMKRLRKEVDERIRFYGSGEYGNETFRPHYHLIIFGLHLDDLVPFGKSELGFQYYRSPLLESKWKFGFSGVSHVTWETCAYVSRYVTKKLKGQAADCYEALGIEPEFCLMSRKPGLAAKYYEEHGNYIYEYDEINIDGGSRGLTMKPPKYFDWKYDLDNPQRMGEIKAARQEAAKLRSDLQRDKTTLSFDERMEIRNRSLVNKEKALLRKFGGTFE
jgi:hypothetical protein